MKMGMWMHLLFVSILAVLIAVIAVPSDNARATGDPLDMGGYYETPGDWTVDGFSGMFVYTSTTIVVNGNLTVASGFTLTLINVNLLMNCLDNGSYSIIVQSGGTLVIQDIDDDPLTTADRSNITSFTPDGDHRFGFIVEGPSGELEMKNSELSECGWEENSANDWQSSGLWIGTDNLVSAPIISGNEIRDCVIGITLYQNTVGADISDNDIHDCSYSGIELNQTNNAVVHNNVLTACGNNGSISYAIHGWLGTNNEFSYNEVINHDYFGILLRAQSGILVDHNVIRDAPGSGAGLILDGLGGDNYITYNEIYNLTWHGVFVQTLNVGSNVYVNNNTVHDISITDGSVGIIQQYLDLGHLESFDNVVYNIDESVNLGDDNVGMTIIGGSGHIVARNEIYSVSDIGVAIYADDVLFVDNDVYSNGDGIASVWAYDSGLLIMADNTTVKDCRIYDNHPPFVPGSSDVNGIFIVSSSNTHIENTEISNNEINIRGWGDGLASNDALIENCTITVGVRTNENFNLNQNSDFTVIHPNPQTWDNSTDTVQDMTSTLTLKWYLNITVTRGGMPENGASVTVQASGIGADDPTNPAQPYNTAINDGDPGTVKWIPVTEYVQTSTGKMDFTPHWVNATASGSEGFAFPTVWKSKDIEVKLNDIPEVLNLLTEGAATSVYRGSSIRIQTNADDTEDHESDLTPFFEYKVNNTAPWETVYFTGAPIYVGGHWEIEFLPPADAPLGNYDIRVRVEDTYPSSSDWYPPINDNNMIEVLNNPPVLVNITSNLFSLYRGDLAFIIVDCDDVEDGEHSMAVEIEYRSPSGDWSGLDSTLGEPYFDGSRWRAEFTPQTGPIKDETGWYDFRARCQDLDGDWSDWEYAYDLIEVLNNEPVADDLGSGEASIFREIEYTWLFANVTEVEDPESDLTVVFEYLEPGKGWGTEYFNQSSLQYDAGGFWKITFEPPSSAVPGLYSFRVTFTDLDGGMDSLVITGLVEVKNNPPLAHNIDPSDTTTYAGAPDPIYLHVNASDVEDLESELDILAGDDDIQWQYNGPSGGDYTGPWTNTWFGSCYYEVDGEFLKVPWQPSDKAQIGYYGFRVRVTDVDDDKSSPYLVILNAVYVDNLPPPIMSMALDIEEVYRTQEVLITVDVSDTINPENELTPHLEYRIEGASTWSELSGTPYFSGTPPEGYWEIYWTPDASLEPGTYEFQCKFENSEGEFSDYVEATVDITVLNNEPIVQSLVLPSSASRMETVYLIANCQDADEVEEDLDPVFQYETPAGDWMTQGDSSSYFRNAPQYINGKWQIEFQAAYNAPLGDYNFRVKFSDGIDETDWFSAIDDMTLSANPEDPDGDGLLNDQDSDDDGDGIQDFEDAFPYDPAASVDTDEDGDPDDWNPGKTASDSRTGLFLDIDDDNDGTLDNDDDFPLDPAASVDTDSDGKPDSWNSGKDAGDSITGLVLDDDIDGDGVPNDEDAFPLDRDEDTDTDGDGVGNNEDDDDDGDGVLDIKDPAPRDPKIPGNEGSPWYLWVILALVAVVVVVVIIMMWMVKGKKKE